MSPAQKCRLERGIRLPQATALVVGTVVGVAIFVQPSEVARQVSSPAAMLAVWVGGGLMALAGALVCVELASTFREGGGVYRYLTAAFGPGVGFLWSWALFWTIHTSIVAAVAMVSARSLIALLPQLGSEKGLAVVAILLLSAVNLVGVRRGAGVQSLLAAAKVVVLLALAVAGLWLAAPVVAPVAREVSESGGLGAALVAALFTFGGWHLVTFSSAETATPRRTIPRAIGIGFALVLLTYLTLNLAYLRVLGFAGIAASGHTAADAARAIAGDAGQAVVAGVAALSALGALAGLVLVGPRIYFAVARDGMAPGWLGEVHPRFRTPHRALALQAGWACLLVITGSYRTLYQRALVVEWAFFALLGLAAVILRRRGLPRRCSLPVHPVIPLAFSGVALALVLDRLVSDPVGSALGWLPVAAGIPVYWWLRRHELAAAEPARVRSAR